MSAPLQPGRSGAVPSRTSLGDTGLLLVLAALRVAIHSLTNGQYGFHRDELAMLDDARRLAWGYVAYPPLTPFVGRLALELFGPSLVGLRLFAAAAQGLVMVLAGLMARELGGGRWAQVVAALAAAVAPMSLIAGALFQYVSFDSLWWVLVAFLTLRLLSSDNPRWWLAIGFAIGLGMMTKATMAFLVAGLVAGVLLSPARRHLRSPWLWGGAAVSVLVALPYLVWQVQHDFVSLEFLRAIHARDVEIGRADGFLPLQLVVSTSLFTVPLWLAGLHFYLLSPAGARYRPLGWMYLFPLALLLLAQGRFYYLAPAYPMLLAAGSVAWEARLASSSARRHRLGRGLTWGALAAGAAFSIPLMLPVAPVGSALWRLTSGVHDNFVEQIGWPELVAEVARVRDALPREERSRLGILTGNYGEAGAVNLYGPAHGLPPAISGVNSHWARGYGDPPPEVLIVLGFSREGAEDLFESCVVAGRVTNRHDVENEETRLHPDVLVCRRPRAPWPELWPRLRRFG